MTVIDASSAASTPLSNVVTGVANLTVTTTAAVSLGLSDVESGAANMVMPLTGAASAAAASVTTWTMTVQQQPQASSSSYSSVGVTVESDLSQIDFSSATSSPTSSVRTAVTTLAFYSPYVPIQTETISLVPPVMLPVPRLPRTPRNFWRKT